MPFVRRDAAGSINGVFAQKQPGMAEEEIEDNAPELAEFHARNALPGTTPADSGTSER